MLGLKLNRVSKSGHWAVTLNYMGKIDQYQTATYTLAWEMYKS